MEHIWMSERMKSPHSNGEKTVRGVGRKHPGRGVLCKSEGEPFEEWAMVAVIGCHRNQVRRVL